jgi:hypothetical protein
MEFYYFGGNFFPGILDEIKNSNFDGVMFTYDATQGDIFTRIVQQLSTDEKIKYLVAIRPYTISPQYLCMINQSMNLIMGNRIQINLISGYVKDHEKNFGGIIGEIYDLSNKVDRSKYLIKYVDVLNTMPGNQNNSHPLDFYVSTTNKYIEETVNKYNNKIILPYKDYKNGYWTIDPTICNCCGMKISNRNKILKENLKLDYSKVMLAITPILRKNRKQLEELPDYYGERPVWREGEKTKVAVSDVEFFTYEEFNIFIKNLEEKGIKQLLINSWPAREYTVIMDYVKNYSQLKQVKTNT